MRKAPLPILILGFAFAIAACAGQSQSPSGGTGSSAGSGASGTTGGASGTTSGTTGASAGSVAGTSGTSGSAGGSQSGAATGATGSVTGSTSGGSAGASGATGGTGTSGATSGASTGVAGSAGTTGSAGTAGATGSSVTSHDGGAEAGAPGAGDASTDDAAVVCPPATPPTGGTQYCQNSGSGTVDGNYTYNLYSSGQGMGCLTVFGVDATFKANWTNVDDWIGRVGLQFDKTKTYDQLGTLSSDFAYTVTGVTTGGYGNIGIYGWSVSPLHEYYIEEDWLSIRPNFTPVATFTIDGEGTYDVMTNMQTDQPNITGTNQNFVQFWSVRQTPRQCGHISISKHFAEWASLGLQLGDLEEARILVEAQNNSGTVVFTTATVVQGQ
ncbi:MAG TPA: glycoside hydrolase family 11 protein [Polyangiaceae bacterium]|nr:glycoside hydrolase family 11 protein [Polyangiaceae bacterium]